VLFDVAGVTSSVKLGGAAGGFVLASGVPLVAGLDILTLSLSALGLLATVFVGLEVRAALRRQGMKPANRFR
jgi:hypothetical protein